MKEGRSTFAEDLKEDTRKTSSMLANGANNKTGFTLIALIVVLIVIGILAAAVVPIYRFAVKEERGTSVEHLEEARKKVSSFNRAYVSEAKAILGTIRTAERVYATENDTDGDLSDDYLRGDSAHIPSILELLGVDTSTNTWWHAPPDPAPTTCIFGFDTGTNAMLTCTNLALSTPNNHHVYVIGTAGKVKGIEIAMDITTGLWYSYP